MRAETQALAIAPSRDRRRSLVVASLAVALAVVAIASAGVGGVPLSVREIGAMLLSRVGVHVGAEIPPQHEAVFFAIRLPRIALGMLVGGGLAASGAAMQGVFRNPLVDPGLLGVSSGAALFAVVAIVLGASIPGGLSPYTLPVASFAGGLGATFVVRAIARVDGRTSVSTLLLAGIAASGFAGACTGLVTFLANDAQLRTITFWTLGSLGGATWTRVLSCLPFILAPLVALMAYARPLDALLLGESEAFHLGFSVERVKARVVVLVALIVGASVAVSGVIAFVGLVVPHLLRLLVGSRHARLLPGSALLGALLMLVADVVARTAVLPAELPIGIVTAGLGAPFFLSLLLRERRRFA